LDEEQLKGVTLRFWHPYRGQIGAVIDRLANEFSRQNQWGISVQVEAISGVDLLNERVEASLEQGNLPHLAVAPLYHALRWNQQRSILVDWSLYIGDVQWGTPQAEIEQYYPNLWQASQVDGGQWGIPMRRVAQVLLYNATWARELGFSEAPKTVAEFQQQSCSVPAKAEGSNEAEAKGYYFSHDYPTILGWFKAFGAQVWVGDEGKYEFNTPQIKDALAYLRKLYDLGCTLSAGDIDPLEAFVQRRALFVPVQSAQFDSVTHQVDSPSGYDQWTVLPFPTPSGEGALVVVGTDFVLLQSSAQEQLAAWLFVKWFLQKEIQQQLVEETLGLPLRRDVGEALQNETRLPPAYRVTLTYLPLATNEPLGASWGTVRWAVSDASRQLVAWYFSIDQVPSLAELLDKTADDLNSR